MRYRLAMIGLLVLAPIAALAGWWLMPESRITAANTEQIRDGMALEKVEELVGPSDEGPGVFGESGYDGIKFWQSGGRMIAVEFRDGRVRRKIFEETTPWQRIDDWYQGRARRLELVMTMYLLCS